MSQEPVLFATTIAENITAGRQDLTLDQIQAAAKLANAHTFIMLLPENYNAIVGEKGVSLSGGQKQRVAIARAIIREPKILVLDEATSALDAESERVVQDALNDLMGETKMTTLVIAHRLSTVRHADKIVVLSDGHEVEEGPHDELMEVEHGLYRKLYTIQEEKAQEEADAAALALETICWRQEVTVRQRVFRSHSTRSYSTLDSASDMSNETSSVTSESKPAKFTVREANAMSKPERGYFIMGMIGSAINRCSYPASAVLISELVAIMTSKYTQFLSSGDLATLADLRHQVVRFACLYIVGSVVVWIGAVIQSYGFRYVAEKLTSRLRDLHFSSLCRQDVGFFDEKANATGALTADLATSAQKVALISGESQGRLFQGVFTVIAGLLISFLAGS